VFKFNEEAFFVVVLKQRCHAYIFDVDTGMQFLVPVNPIVVCIYIDLKVLPSAILSQRSLYFSSFYFYLFNGLCKADMKCWIVAGIQTCVNLRMS
jgi:hypothetical protein